MASVACAAIAIAPAVAFAAPMLWVSGSGTDSGFCSQANPCRTISRAVSLAIPTGTIVVGPGQYTDHVTIDSSVSPLTIQGAGVGATNVSGGFDGSGSVFTVQKGATATITDMSIVGGQAPNGGGVNDAGNLTLQRDLIGFNGATGTGSNGVGLGGGVYASSVPALSISDTQIVSNQANNAGGGIYAASTGFPSIVTRDLINSNTVMSSNGDGGGAVAFYAGTWSDDTITGNQILNGSTPSGNGGGLWAEVASLTSDTIAGNTAATSGGLYFFSGQVSGTIISGNRGGNCGLLVGDAGDNLEDDAANSCQLRPSLGDRIGVDPQLGPLSDNGGPTKTMAIPGSSPAHDASSECTGTDQRGVSRLQRGATSCDIGAYQVEAPTTYVANPAGGSVTAYATGASGDATPVLKLSGPATGLNQPTGVVADDTGDVFVANAGNNSITEYAPEVTGNAAPTVTISGPLTRLSSPQDVAVGPDGRLYVTNLNGTVTGYAAAASGNAIPVTTVSGATARLFHPHGLVFDGSGQLRVATDAGTVNTYALHTGLNTTPRAILRMSAGANPEGFNFDPDGNLVVADAAGGRVLTYAGDALGAAAPTSTLTPAPSGFSKPIGLDLDLSGHLFVADSGSDSVAEFPAGASGSAAPSALISGPDTGLAAPAFLSELPPPPAPGVRLRYQKRQPRSRVLGRGILIGGNAFGRYAFRDRPVTITAVARVRGRIIARSKARPLRPGAIKVMLLTTKDAARIIRSHRSPAVVTVTVTVRGGAGVQNRRLTIICTR